MRSQDVYMIVRVWGEKKKSTNKGVEGRGR